MWPKIFFVQLVLALNLGYSLQDVFPEKTPLEVTEEVIEDEENQLQDLVEEVQNKAKFPLDMILGNPQMVNSNFSVRKNSFLEMN